MTPDNNKVQFLTNVTSLLIPQRMNFFNKEEKVNFVKWYYFGLSFRDMQAIFPVFSPERPIPSLTSPISLLSLVVTSVTLPSYCYFDKAFNFFSIIVYFRKMLQKKTNKNWEPFLQLYNFCI
jgi:hypothetical protein